MIVVKSYCNLNIVGNSSGLIPVPVMVVLAVTALLGAGGIGFILGKGVSFSIGLGLGIALVVILPNLERIVRWGKGVALEIKSTKMSPEE